jgi:hypothetical protein
MRTATPCDASWESMSGDERVRRCTLCDRDVFDLAQVSAPQSLELLCRGGASPSSLHLHRRKDGTVITSDCARGIARRKRRLAVLGVAAGAAATVASLREPIAEAFTPIPPEERLAELGFDAPCADHVPRAPLRPFDGHAFIHGRPAPREPDVSDVIASVTDPPTDR